MRFDKDNFFGYSVRLSQLSQEDGGGWIASIVELDGCMADGDTPDEAYEELKEALDFWLEVAREEAKSIPEPTVYEDVQYSGRTMIRMPRNLHRILAEQAALEGVSLNQYMVSLLSYNAGRFENSVSREPAQVVNLIQQYVNFAKPIQSSPQDVQRMVERSHLLSHKRFDERLWGGVVGHEIRSRQ
ncbi:MAG: type II toxin-antitoxin system HicB family antitoxin [Firmicutes bacterium]|nr:type II toxin-antitoxin system HicB family antitoxin [Bacillota bacterium]